MPRVRWTPLAAARVAQITPGRQHSKLPELPTPLPHGYYKYSTVHTTRLTPTTTMASTSNMADRPPLSALILASGVFFFSLAVALARNPSNLREKEVAADPVTDSLTVPTSEVKSILRLPGGNDESNSRPDRDSDSQALASVDSESAESITVRSVPLTVLRFHDLRPINRQFFPVRPRLPLRHCRHHHQRHHHGGNAFLKPVETQPAAIPYGDDVVVTKEEEKNDMEIEPVSWVRMPYHRHSHHHNQDKNDGFSKYLLKHGHRFGNERYKKHLHLKRRDDEIEAEEDDNEEERVKEQSRNRENGKKEEGGFVKRIRKFLNHF